MSIVSPRPWARATSDGTRADRSGRRHRTLRRFGAALASAAVTLAVAAPTALAQDLTITTPYPAVVVAPGSNVSFNVEVQTSTPERVELTLTGAPDTWNASLHGGGFVIDAVQTNGTDPETVRVDVDVPADAAGTTRMTLRGTIGSEVVELPLSVRVQADVTGDVTLVTDFPSLRGPSSQTFNFNLTLSNDTAEDLTFSVNAQAPTGWTVEATLTGQSQAASAIIEAGSSTGVTVSAEPPPDAAAGTYDIAVVAVAGERQISGALQVEVTGSYDLALTTQGGAPLNSRGAAGTTSPMVINVTNSGTAPVTNVRLTSSAPSDWEITFEPETIASIAADETVQVTAQVRPSGDAIAGDYNITFTASGDASTRDTMEIRYTVETSLLWGVIGAALIVAVVAGVWWVFQRYGRR